MSSNFRLRTNIRYPDILLVLGWAKCHPNWSPHVDHEPEGVTHGTFMGNPVLRLPTVLVTTSPIYISFLTNYIIPHFILHLLILFNPSYSLLLFYFIWFFYTHVQTLNCYKTEVVGLNRMRKKSLISLLISILGNRQSHAFYEIRVPPFFCHPKS